MSKDLKRKSDQIDLDLELKTKESKNIVVAESDSSQFESVESNEIDDNDELDENSATTSKKKIDSEYISKIKSIISTNFDQEINYKVYELEKIDEVILFLSFGFLKDGYL